MAQKRGRIALLVMSIVCAVTFTTGMLTLNGGTAKAAETTLYSADFENLSDASTADDIFQNTGIAGGNRSIVTALPNYINAIYTFWDNGCQHQSLYLDTGRGISSTDVSKTYKVEMTYQHFGYVANTTLGLQGPTTGDYNSALILRADGTSQVDNYGAEQFVSAGKAVLGADGWWDIEFTFTGTGGYLFPIFWMNSSDYAKANEELNTGLNLAEFKVTCEDATVYEMKVNAGIDTNDGVYQACAFAAAAPVVLKTIAGTEGINGKTLKVTYTFWEDGGWQNNNLYSDTNRINLVMEAGEEYVLRFKTKLFGHARENYIIVKQLDAANGFAQKGEAQAILRADGTFAFADYQSGDSHTLVEGKSTVTVANGIFDVVMVVKGLGYNFQLIGNYWCSDPVSANANHDTGMYLDDFTIAKYVEDSPEDPEVPEEPEVDEKYDVVYSQDFNNVSASTSGSDAMYHATGFAGALHELSIDTTGVNGSNALKGIYTFWDNGWQHVSIYTDTGRVNVTMEDGKEYIVEFKAKLLGSASSAVIRFLQLDPNNGWSMISEDQAILNSNGTVDFFNISGNSLNSENCSYTVDANGVYSVKVAIKGLGHRFQMLGNMCSSDYAASNENLDTGLLFDDFKVLVEKEETEEPEVDVSGDYRVSYVQGFESVDSLTSGSDAMYHASGFAGATKELVIETEAPISGNKSLKVVHEFWEDGGWQKANAYLDSGRTSNTAKDSIYRFSMKVKPFGHWAMLAIGFAYNNDASKDVIFIKADGSTSADIAYNGALIKYDVTEESGVYTVVLYMYGCDSYIFNYFHMQASDAALANNEATGFYLDDYEFAKQLKAEGAGLDKKAEFYNKYTGGNFITNGTFTSVESVAISDITLSNDQYSYENGVLTVYESVLKTLDNGTYTLTAVSEADVAEVTLLVDNVAMGSVYETDFAGMPALNGGQEGNDNFFFNSYMDPGRFDIYTVDEGDNRYVKFVKSEVSEAFTQLFQFNPNPGRLNCLTKDKWHSISTDIKLENVSQIAIDIRVHEATADPNAYYMELDLVKGERIDDGKHSPYASWQVVDKGNGWYTLTVNFMFTGEYTDNAVAYLMYNGCQISAESAYYFDNIVVQSELIPYVVNGKQVYDVASSEMPYAIIDLCGAFDISAITVGETALTAGVEYTTNTTPTGTTRVNFAKSFLQNYSVGETIAIRIATTKGNVIAYDLAVIDTTPVLPSEVLVADIAIEQSLTASVDLKGYEIAGITLNETALVGTEYIFNSALGSIEFKYTYLKTLAVGTHVYTIVTTSGAVGTFSISIENSTPVISDVVYEKNEGGNLTVNVDVKGKEITAVVIGEFALTAGEYSYENGVLTINESAIASLNAGEYELTVTTVASVTVKLTVNDAPPAFEGEYTAKVGEDLVITVNVYGKEIVSVSIDGLELLAEEYSYADGKLTISGAVFEELAEGERVLTLVTEGGNAELTFALTKVVADSSSGEVVLTSCNSSLAGSGMLSMLAIAIALIFKKRR